MFKVLRIYSGPVPLRFCLSLPLELAVIQSKSGVRAVSWAGQPDLLKAYLAYLDQPFQARTLV
jgi:hypothetical protein